ncbi:MAG: flagellar filament capping protein FliD [Desulfobacterales bacterium]|nr:flagellar filament capping protein FliD [Desulfobacterales bacterium]
MAISLSSVGTIQYSGITSDTNWADLVDDLVEVERYTINSLESWKAEWEEKVTVIGGLESELLQLSSYAGDINSEDDFYKTTVVSSDEGIVTTSSYGSPAPGAHTVEVGSLIPHIIASNPVSENTEAVGTIAGSNFSQDLIISAGNNNFTVDYTDSPADPYNGEFDATSSLEEIVTAINYAADNLNDDGSNSVVTASIEENTVDGTYRLILTAMDGGDDNRITISENPLNLNFNSNLISNAVESEWSGATVTSSGISTSVENKTYTFTASSNGTIGQTDSLIINWDDGIGNTGAFDIGSGYETGDTIIVSDGIKLSFSDGDIVNGETFNVNIYTNTGDPTSLDMDSTSATPVISENYSGSTNKSFSFEIQTSGTLGSDEIEISWEDSEGNSGTATIPASYETGDGIEIYQGLSISFDTSEYQELFSDNTFKINVYNTTIQNSQDSGLAQVEIETHDGFSDDDTSYVNTSEGTFSYIYGGITRTLTISENSTLTDLCEFINNDDDNPGVYASIVNDGSGSSTSYHLQLTGNDTGAAFKIENITHTLDNFYGDNSGDSGFSETQSAQNSMLVVDGFPDEEGKYLQRTSNVVGDVINGITISLADTGTVTVTISNDINAVTTNIQEMLDAVNNILDYIAVMTAHLESGDSVYNGKMIGNYTFQIIEQKINDILTSSVAGLSELGNEYTLLSQLGISTEDVTVEFEDGNGDSWEISTPHWVIDDDILSEALSTNFEDVCNFFVNNDSTGIVGFAELMYQEMEALTNDYSSEDPGPLQVLMENYADIIDNTDKKIEREEYRISLVENRLNTKFAALEVTLGALSSQETTLSSLVESLSE